MKLREAECVAIARTEVLTEKNLRSSYKLALEMFNHLPEFKAAEIGVYEGVNALYMLLLSDKIRLYLVDAWDNCVIYTGGPVQPKEFCEMIKQVAAWNLAGFGNRIVFTYKNSLEAAECYQDNYFEYVYVDGDHEKEAVKQDLSAWWPKVKPGGLFAGHDCKMEGVSSAVKEFMLENGILEYRLNLDSEAKGRSDWWIIK